MIADVMCQIHVPTTDLVYGFIAHKVSNIGLVGCASAIRVKPAFNQKIEKW